MLSACRGANGAYRNGLQLVVHMGGKRPDASCLVITGHDDPVLRKEAEHLHARYLVKPIGRSDFLAEIEELAAADDRSNAGDFAVTRGLGSGEKRMH